MQAINLSIAALCSVLCAGCTGVSYIVDNYGEAPLQKISTRYDEFRVFDKPTDNRLMITPSLGNTAGNAFVGGLLLNPTIGATPRPVYQEAVEKFLADSGRDCRVTDGYLIVEPQWEFRYSCDSTKVALAR
jgi:hypothetical protein